MFKDLMRKKAIIAKSAQIADEIIKRYPPRLDEPRPGESKADVKKKQRKLAKALRYGRTEIKRTSGEMRLGIYGKAKLCKTVQDIMLTKGYSDESTRMITEELAITV